MSDPFLELAQNPTARKLVQRTGLPIPMPQPLARPEGPYVERPLEGKSVLAGGDGTLLNVVASTVVGTGASPLVSGEKAATAFAEPGEANGRKPRAVSEVDAASGERVHGLVFDGTAMDTPEKLRALYDFFHPWVGSLDKCGRVVVLGRPADAAKSAEEASARNALDGFARSVAKEIGKKGSTANLIVVDDGAEARVPAVLRFFLSPASAFVSAQPLRVSTRAGYDGRSPWVHSLQGKVALVTGAARGIGAAIAERLALEGAHVVCLDRPEDGGPLGETARKVSGSALLADVSDPKASATIADTLKREHDGVDLVVHNAGVTRDKTLARMQASHWDQTIGVNLAAIERVTQALVESHVLRDQGRVVCLSSVAGIAGNVGQTNYAASKAGLIGYVRFMAPKLAERGVTVNAVAPGFIDTRMTAAVPFVIREAGRRLSALGQGGQPADVANVITFLCSPGAGGVTGNVLRICGGALIGA